MQDFTERGFHDARFVLKILALDPVKFGGYLRKMIPKVDDEYQPQIGMEKVASVYYTRSMSGECNLKYKKIYTIHSWEKKYKSLEASEQDEQPKNICK